MYVKAWRVFFIPCAYVKLIDFKLCFPLLFRVRKDDGKIEIHSGDHYSAHTLVWAL